MKWEHDIFWWLLMIFRQTQHLGYSMWKRATRCYKEECNILPHEALRTDAPIKGAKIKMLSPLRALLSNVVQIWNVY